MTTNHITLLRGAYRAQLLDAGRSLDRFVESDSTDQQYLDSALSVAEAWWSALTRWSDRMDDITAEPKGPTITYLLVHWARYQKCQRLLAAGGER